MPVEKAKSDYRNHALFFLFYCFANFFMWLTQYNGDSYVFLVWNVFLAFLPVLFSQWFSRWGGGGRVGRLLPGFLWLIFWPNTFYMVTDVIHFGGDAFVEISWEFPYTSSGQVVYSTDLFLWMKLLLVVAGILYAVRNGVYSQKEMEEVVIAKLGHRAVMPFRIACAVLGGVAIYLGRFLRVNSWDIFSPAKILSAYLSLGYSGKFVGGFVGLFTLFILGALCFSRYYSRPDQ